ncbi:MAG TPA: 30S ribosomal protein S2 [Thermodesulfobacteriota bacterium]|nr:30S ribosomal protein S2 [Thermodesulfobacteriota bacterium]
MAYLTMKQLLESGVHFGHQTRRWNPKMKPYIYGARNGIYIIDLQQTVKMFKDAYDFIRKASERGGKVLFVGTKKQAQKSIEEEAKRVGMYYVNNRWIGGFLTNFSTVRKSIDRLNKLQDIETNPEFVEMTKKEKLMLSREKARLEKYLGGVREMKKLPEVLFVIDSKKEYISIREARKMGITVVAVVDSNCDPDEVDFIIPGNDDAIRAIKLFSSSIADACAEGAAAHKESVQAAGEGEEAPVEAAPVAPVKAEKAAQAGSTAAEPAPVGDEEDEED